MTSPSFPNESMVLRLNEMVQHTKLLMDTLSMAPEKFQEVFLGTGLKMDVNRGSLSSDGQSLSSGLRLAFDLKDKKGLIILADSVLGMELVTSLNGQQRWEMSFNDAPLFALKVQDRSENNKLPENKQKPIEDGPWITHPLVENNPQMRAFADAAIVCAHEQSKTAATHCLKSEVLNAVKSTRAEMYSKPPEVDPELDKAMKISSSVDSFLNSLKLGGKGAKP